MSIIVRATQQRDIIQTREKQRFHRRHGLGGWKEFHKER